MTDEEKAKESQHQLQELAAYFLERIGSGNARGAMVDGLNNTMASLRKLESLL